LGRAIHDGLLKVGFEVIRSRVTKRTWLTENGPRFRGRRTLPHHHAPEIAAAELLIAATIGFAINSLMRLADYSAWPC
jgi:hypothetical protein